MELEAAPLEIAGARPLAHEAADRPTGVGERPSEPSADEPGRAGHERAPARAPRRGGFGVPFEGVVS